jgi:hypothetical protein
MHCVVHLLTVAPNSVPLIMKILSILAYLAIYTKSAGQGTTFH